MNYEEVIAFSPAAEPVLVGMPEELRHRFTIRTIPPKTVIHQKDDLLGHFGIVLKGDHRVINEFENGNIFMIEKNEPIAFIGEVTLLADKAHTSVTIETLTECTVLFMTPEDFEIWVSQDIIFLRFLAKKVALKLYHSSYNRGERHFYNSTYLLTKYVINYAGEHGIEEKGKVVVRKTRQELYEELGMTIKTIGRIIDRLKEDGVITMEKGKMAITTEQYELAQERIGYYMERGKK